MDNESWTIKKAEHRRTDAFFRTVVLEKTLESPLESKEIKPVNLKGNQSWILFGRTNAEAEASVLWPPDANSWLIGKTLMMGKIEAEGEEGDREWDGWILSLIQWTLTWANSGRWWGTGKPGVLQSMGSWSVGPGLVTEQPSQHACKGPVSRIVTLWVGTLMCKFGVDGFPWQSSG